MTEPKRPLLSIRRKPKITVNPKHAEKPAPSPKPAKPPKAKAPKPVKEPKPKQPPPRPLSREERIARNRAKKLRRGQEAIASLMAHWPQLFSLEQPKPLKTGIAALMFYTQTSAYQQAVHAGGSRFDLGGQPCGEVTEEQQAHALKQLEKWQSETESAASSGAEPTP